MYYNDVRNILQSRLQSRGDGISMWLFKHDCRAVASVHQKTTDKLSIEQGRNKEGDVNIRTSDKRHFFLFILQNAICQKGKEKTRTTYE